MALAEAYDEMPLGGPFLRKLPQPKALSAASGTIVHIQPQGNRVAKFYLMGALVAALPSIAISIKANVESYIAPTFQAKCLLATSSTVVCVNAIPIAHLLQCAKRVLINRDRPSPWIVALVSSVGIKVDLQF